MELSCLKCEGHGVIRYYLDRAGSYEKYHCRVCGGTGKNEYTEPVLMPKIREDE